MPREYGGKRVLVTGGASFIGSHLVDRLCQLGAEVTVLDNLSSGRLENLSQSPDAKFLKLDLQYSPDEELRRAFRGKDQVFHLAAVHGGRGYIDTHPADVVANFSIDHHVFELARREDVSHVAFASSACVYPPRLQGDVGSDYRLTESDADLSDLRQPLSADLEYGWAKLMGEMQLRAFVRQYGTKGVSLRFVTAYGERENETHAIIALIYKAFQKMDPFEIWGDGEQSRDFTYVSDIVEGSLLAARKVSDGSAINLGTGVRYSLNTVAQAIFDTLGFHPRVRYDGEKPTGVANRALDITRAAKLLGWHPQVGLQEGLRRTVDWYRQTHRFVGRIDPRVLMERIDLPVAIAQ